MNKATLKKLLKAKAQMETTQTLLTEAHEEVEIDEDTVDELGCVLDELEHTIGLLDSVIATAA